MKDTLYAIAGAALGLVVSVILIGLGVLLALQFDTDKSAPVRTSSVSSVASNVKPTLPTVKPTPTLTVISTPKHGKGGKHNGGKEKGSDEGR